MSATASRHLLPVLLLAAATPALADSVNGQFVLDGKPPLKPIEVAAFRVADSFNLGKMSTLVLLTSKPVNRATITKSSDPETTALNDPAAQTDYIQVFVTDDDLVSLDAHLDGKQYLHSTRIGLVASCTNKTPEHVACTVKTAEPVKFMAEPAWSLDLTFDSAVLAHTADK